MKLFNFADISNEIALNGWATAVRGYGLANKIAGYVLGFLIAIFIIVGIGLIVKHVVDRRGDKRTLITGILIMVVGAIVCSVLLGVLTGSIFPNEIKKLAQEGVAQQWITGNGPEFTKGTNAPSEDIFQSVLAVFKSFKTTLA